TALGVSSGAEPFMIHYDPNGDHDGDRTANSRDPDDDGDGLSDAEEIAEHRTNPTAFDTDGDGLGDGDEIDLGTDPLARDTDRDGTIDGEDPDPTDPDVPGRCPPEKDVRCAGININAPPNDEPGLWAFKADASPSAPPFAPSYTFTARKTGSATSLIAGPQSASTASFDLDEGPWTISVIVDWGDDCPS